MAKKEFKVGELVTDPRYGKGKIQKIISTPGIMYPVEVVYDTNAEATYTSEGKYAHDDVHPTLIHGHFDEIVVKGIKPKIKS